ncbi:glutathione S-transferase [Alteromonas sp. ASW11-130]|uniref:glutathione S-transferase n=1 Tax=Alteromonas sp. ASW11-130 TaxID=3015775 RepID=UPI0022427132|nr:glutathione S-transferase [Alteromonas sp. ASW11-130]MCW8091078.1 glutathione S-transferase [Alteromonas sp. ASW11-130]
MLTLHYLNDSRSQRILWLLEELNVDYNLAIYQRDAKTGLAPKELKAIHQLGRAPVLTTEHGAIAESGAIIEYVITQFANDTFQTPADERAYQSYLFWMHFAEGSLMPPLVAMKVLFKAREKSPFLFKPVVNKMVEGIIRAYYGPNLEQSLKYVESWLASHEWFAGNEPTGADVQMSFPLESLVATGRAKAYPAITRYVQRVHERPAYQRALSKGGKYAYA